MIKCLPRHTWLQVTAWKYENKMGPKLMTFRCAGPVFWPLGNHAKAKPNAPGLPRQTSRPTRALGLGLPTNCSAPSACRCLHLPTVVTAGAAQLPLLPEVQPCHLPSPGVVPSFSPPTWAPLTALLVGAKHVDGESLHPPSQTCSSLDTLRYFIVPSSSLHPALAMDRPELPSTQAPLCPHHTLVGCTANGTPHMQHLLLPRTRWMVARKVAMQVGSQLSPGTPVDAAHGLHCRHLTLGF